MRPTRKALARRVARRYLRNAARSWPTYRFDNPGPGEDYVEEVLDKNTQEALANFLQDLILRGRRINKLLEAQIRTVERYTGQRIPPTMIHRYLKEWLEKGSPWGKDAMTPLLTELILNGKFVS